MSSSRYFNAFRIAAYVLVLFMLGHTFGAVVATPRFGGESDAVVSLMKSVHVTSQSADCTWYGFYRGFGVLVSIWFVFSAVLAWHVGGMSPGDRRLFAPVTWALFLCHAAGAVVAWVYFFPAPQLFSSVIALLLGYACMGGRGEPRVRATAR